jgi:putative ABC transport system permease protein
LAGLIVAPIAGTMERSVFRDAVWNSAMTRWQLIRHSLRYYWRTNLALVLGVVVGAAVIGGALIVGDSMRGSLRKMTLDRLQQVDYLVAGHRFFREQLADELAARLKSEGTGASIAPVLTMPGGLQRKAEGSIRRAGKVSIYGVDDRAWKLLNATEPVPADTGLVLNQEAADALAAKVGDTVTLWIELPSAIPRDSLLGNKDNDAQEIDLTVSAIAPDESGPGRFGVQPSQLLPLNAFVNLKTLQDRLDLAEIRPTQRDPRGAPARVNALLAAMPTADNRPGAAKASAAHLSETLDAVWMPTDLGLRLIVDETLGVLSVESETLILEDRLAEATEKAAAKLKLGASPVMVYLANWLRNADKEQGKKHFSMYSTVAGLDVAGLAPPFGPFEFAGPRPEKVVEGEILLNDYLAEDLQVKVGDEIRMGYHIVGSHGELPEEGKTVRVAGIVKLEGPAADRNLTPEVKGITDVESLDDWDQPFPMTLDKVTPRDDEYWDRYRATPKAFVPLAAAQAWWPSRYGTLTSIRVAPLPGKSAGESIPEFRAAVLAELTPDELGLGFVPIKALGLQAATGSNDFAGLFIGFSLFLILSAIILVGLLFRLGLEQRVRQVGLLAALGYPPRQVARLLLIEGTLLSLLGGALGCLAAIGYAHLMVYGLKTWWIGAVGTRFLFVFIQPTSVLAGSAIAVIAALGAMAWSLRQLRAASVREQLVGVLDPDVPLATQIRRMRGSRRRALISGSLALVAVLGILTGLIPSGDAFAGFSWAMVVFFVAGMLLLTAGLSGFSAWLQGAGGPAVKGRGRAAFTRLGLKNAARQRSRSVLTTGLIAAATFLITAVAAGQRDPSAEHPDKASGNGGYTLVAETSSPVLYDLNTEDGRRKLGLPENPDLWKGIHVSMFRVKPGQEASCLNLFQTTLPTILGVPPELIERGGFKFMGLGGNPWKLLQTTNPDGTIPVFGDANSLDYSLHKSPGQEIPLPAGTSAAPATLKVAGKLDSSIFQGVLLMSEEHFLQLFPEQKGFQYLLVETPWAERDKVAELLETELNEYGCDTEPVAERLARFLSVQNTYLSTFQSLGGLGLLLGTLGLATVMLRNVLERRSELALLRAVGYRPPAVRLLVLAEASLLLVGGLAIGAGSAVIAMSPHLLSLGATPPWLSGALLLTGVLITGLLATTAAVVAAVRTPILESLRGE